MSTYVCNICLFLRVHAHVAIGYVVCVRVCVTVNKHLLNQYNQDTTNLQQHCLQDQTVET